MITLFIYGQNCNDRLEEALSCSFAHRIKPVKMQEFLADPDFFVKVDEKVIVCAYSDDIKLVFELAKEKDFSVALVANEDQSSLKASFELPSKIEEALELALESDPKDIDLLYAGDNIVLWMAVIGDAPLLVYRSSLYTKNTLWQRIGLFAGMFKKIKNLKQSNIKLSTQKGQEINAAASGVVAIEHDNNTVASNVIKGSLSTNDGQLSVILVSPSSIINYLSYLMSNIVKKRKKSSLPSSLGTIKSESVYVESSPKLEVKVDGELVGETPVSLNVCKRALKLCVGEKFWERSNGNGDTKESIKVENISTTKESVAYLQKKLPLFTHASEEQYKDLFVNLKDEGKTNSIFVTLMILSTVLATVGLFLNSASVVIGAMLLAPLMQPIVSFSMGVLRRNEVLLYESFKTVCIGVALVLASAAFIAFWLPLDNVTDEIAARLRPSILDLMVALASGVAAAYAKNNEKIAGSLAGVAIAVALVPPLATAGIGLGWMRWDVFYSAFLLFSTNFVGIVFAAAMTFLMLGFSPITTAKKGLFYSIVGSVLISIPLYLSFATMVEDAEVIKRLEYTSFTINNKDVRIENSTLHHVDGKTILKCDLIVSDTFGPKEIEEVKKVALEAVEKEIEIQAVVRYRF